MADDDLGRMLAELSDEQLTQLGDIAQSNIFTTEQFRRAEALKVAREVLVGQPPQVAGGAFTGPITGKAAAIEPFDLVYVAAYIENGYVADEVVERVEQSDQVPVPNVLAAQWHELELGDGCPGDPTHLVRAHAPGGAWFGIPLDHGIGEAREGDPREPG